MEILLGIVIFIMSIPAVLFMIDLSLDIINDIKVQLYDLLLKENKRK